MGGAFRNRLSGIERREQLEYLGGQAQGWLLPLLRLGRLSSPRWRFLLSECQFFPCPHRQQRQPTRRPSQPVCPRRARGSRRVRARDVPPGCCATLQPTSSNSSPSPRPMPTPAACNTVAASLNPAQAHAEARPTAALAGADSASLLNIPRIAARSCAVTCTICKLPPPTSPPCT